MMNSSHSHSHRHNRGFTLVELIMAAALIGIIGVIIAKFSGDVFSFNRYFNNSISISDRAQKLLRPIAQEIRSASAANNGAYAIDTMQTNDFSFYSDIDNDGIQEKIRYYLSGTNLLKDTIEPTGNPLVYNTSNKVTSTIVNGVQNVANGNAPIFRYFDSSYTGSTAGEVLPSSGNVTAIRLIKVTLYIDSDLNTPPPAQVVSILVAVRNLKQQI